SNLVGSELALDHMGAGEVEQGHETSRSWRGVYICRVREAQSMGPTSVSTKVARSAARTATGRVVAPRCAPRSGAASPERFRQSASKRTDVRAISGEAG